MTETPINTTTNKSLSHHHNILKKNFTYSSSMDQQGISNQLNQHNENHATNGNSPMMMHRANSLIVPEEHQNEDINLNAGGISTNQHHHHHHHHHHQQDSVGVINKLHRTNEVEDLTEKLFDEQDNLTRSNLELFNHQAHLKRTNELENLNEINNDE
jgi:hypothetical protein